MNQTATTLEQSRKLLSLGIDPETADMFYTNYANKHNDGIAYIGKVGIREDLIPAWSLAALITILPEWIEVMDKYSDGDIYITELVIRVDNDKWHVSYCNELEKYNPDIFAACIDLIEQLVRQGYIKTKKV